jgi:hypothetical protein
MKVLWISWRWNLGRKEMIWCQLFSYSPNIDDACLKCLSEHCSILEYLDLSIHWIKHLSQGCQHLKSLELQCCNITLKSLKNLSLEYLDISYCENTKMKDLKKIKYFKNRNIIKIECRE